jgi:hypothetical protein
MRRKPQSHGGARALGNQQTLAEQGLENIPGLPFLVACDGLNLAAHAGGQPTGPVNQVNAGIIELPFAILRKEGLHPENRRHFAAFLAGFALILPEG